MKTLLAWTLFTAALILYAQPKPTLKEAEQRLVEGDYLSTLNGAIWAAKQGDLVIDTLAKMLANTKTYEAKGMTGAFPFNALWALARMGSPKALKVLEAYYAKSKDKTAKLAIDACKLRKKMKAINAGILINDRTLYEKPNADSKQLVELKAGEPLKLIKAEIINQKETGPRGGETVYDYVEVISTHKRGYLQRAGDHFFPLM